VALLLALFHANAHPTKVDQQSYVRTGAADTDAEERRCRSTKDKPLVFDSDDEVFKVVSDLIGYGYSMGWTVMKKLGVVGIILFILCGVAQAQRPAKIYGHGLLTCGRWTAARSDGGDPVEKQDMTVWADGYVSAISVHDPHLRETDVAGMESWLDNYCREHPLDIFQVAVQHLVFELNGDSPNAQ